jgi:hypothetical protein
MLSFAATGPTALPVLCTIRCGRSNACCSSGASHCLPSWWWSRRTRREHGWRTPGWPSAWPSPLRPRSSTAFHDDVTNGGAAETTPSDTRLGAAVVLRGRRTRNVVPSLSDETDALQSHVAADEGARCRVEECHRSHGREGPVQARSCSRARCRRMRRFSGSAPAAASVAAARCYLEAAVVRRGRRIVKVVVPPAECASSVPP